MSEIWEIIEKMDENQRKNYISGTKDECKISNAYFLTLNENHILHPKNTRSVLCKIGGKGFHGGTGIKQLWERKDKKTGGSHYFKREVAWDEVWLIEYKNEKGKKERETFRIVGSFYRKDKKSIPFYPVYQRNEIDKKIPDKYTVISTLKAGQVIKLKEEKGAWEISKLGKRATLKNLKSGNEKSLSYKKLFEQISPSTRKKVVS